jgi:hypothetical protein
MLKKVNPYHVLIGILIICIISSFAVTFWLSLKHSNPSTAKKNEPWGAQGQNPPKAPVTNPQSAVPIIAATDQKTSEEQKAASNIKNYQWLKKHFSDLKITDILLTIFSGALALYTYRLRKSADKLWSAGERQIAVALDAAKAAQRSADVAKDTLNATQRPWIQIKDIKIVGPMEFIDEQARINLEFTLKNVGKSPALRTDLKIKLTISNTLDLRAEQNNFAGSIIAAREYAETNPLVVQTEFGFFPDEEINFSTTAWMDRTELARFREWAGKYPGAAVYPAVVGGVFYEFTFEKGHHQTGIIFGLQKRTPYPPNRRPSYSVVAPNMPIQDVRGAVHLEGRIPMDDLIFSQLIVGTGPIT